MFRIMEGLLLCFIFSNAGSFFIKHYGLVQNWMLLLLLLISLVPLALRSRKKIKVNGILSTLFICGLMYLVGFTREPASVVGLAPYLMPLISFFYLFLFFAQLIRKAVKKNGKKVWIFPYLIIAFSHSRNYERNKSFEVLM